MHTNKWLGMALSILCLASFACGGKSTPAKDDPNTPAVVKAPPPVLASDTAKPEKTPVVADDVARNTLARHYALVGASLAFGDAGLARAEYASDAELTTINGTFVGIDAILKEFGSLSNGKTIKEFSRRSRVFHVVDSTVVDSGSYALVSSRSPKDSVIERGSYASTWRVQAAPKEWVLTKDHLYSTVAKKAK